MSTTLRITVTKEILERSKMCGQHAGFDSNKEKNHYPENCAISLAIKDVFPRARVHYERVDLFGEFDFTLPVEDFVRATLPLPKTAQWFIYVFDFATPEERSAMTPISFDIELPDWVIERIDISEVTKQLQNHPNLELQTA